MQAPAAESALRLRGRFCCNFGKKISTVRIHCLISKTDAKRLFKSSLDPRIIFLLPSKDQNGGSIKNGAGRRCSFRLIFAG